MKLLEKFVLILYSLFILVISAVVCLIIFQVINFDQIKYCIDFVLNDAALAITIVSVSVVCILLSVRCIFFRKKKQIKKSTSTDILLENDSGRLLISKTAIENAAKNIVKDSLNLNTDMKVTVDIDPANNISIYISIMLDRAIKVRDLTLDLQLKIKNQIKDDFGLEVKQVNIKVDSDAKELEKLEKANEKELEKLQKAKEKELERLKKANEIVELEKEDNCIESANYADSMEPVKEAERAAEETEILELIKKDEMEVQKIDEAIEKIDAEAYENMNEKIENTNNYENINNTINTETYDNN